MNDLGITILERTDSMMVVIQSNNIGRPNTSVVLCDQVAFSIFLAALVVIRPFNSSDGSCSEQEIVVSSSLLNDSQGQASSLHLPPTLLNDTLGRGFKCSDVGIVAVVYNNVDDLLEESESIAVPVGRCTTQQPQLNSVVISAVVVNSSETVDSTSLSHPITITLQHDDTSLEKPTCAFINEEELQGEAG